MADTAKGFAKVSGHQGAGGTMLILRLEELCWLDPPDSVLLISLADICTAGCLSGVGCWSEHIL